MTGFIVADDLTGACDAGAAFAAREFEVLVMPFEAELSGRNDLIALTTETRDEPADLIRARVGALLERTSAFESGFLYKKIDSMFRGNTVIEIIEWMNLLPNKFVIMAPAYPAQGRRIINGLLFASDIAGECVVDLAAKFREQTSAFQVMGVIPEANSLALAERLIGAHRAGRRLILYDTYTETDLDAIVDAGWQSGLDILWAGSAGLAHALARALPKGRRLLRAAQRQGPVVFCIGSDHAVTLLQIEHLKSVSNCIEIFVDSQSRLLLKRSLEAGADVLLRISRNRCDSEMLSAALASISTTNVGALVMSGGDTAAMVCRALRIDAIELRGEVLPGIPWGVIRGGFADGVSIVTKSGGFGDDDALVRAVPFVATGARSAHDLD
jgi:D-threonate/D-erythronate kinase